MKQIAITAITCLACLATGSRAAETNRYQAEGASKLEQEGRLEDAFLAFLKIPGAEYRAAGIGRAEPDRFLRVLLHVLHASSLYQRKGTILYLRYTQ